MSNLLVWYRYYHNTYFTNKMPTVKFLWFVVILIWFICKGSCPLSSYTSVSVHIRARTRTDMIPSIPSKNYTKQEIIRRRRHTKTCIFHGIFKFFACKLRNWIKIFTCRAGSCEKLEINAHFITKWNGLRVKEIFLTRFGVGAVSLPCIQSSCNNYSLIDLFWLDIF